MSMTLCRDCGKQISRSAKSCPQCGAPPPKQTSAATWAVLIFIVGFTAFVISNKDETQRRPTPEKTAAELRAERIEKAFSPWDGSHRGVEREIKARMNDPSSYEHVETRYTDKGDFLLVRTTFRGKNAFGGLIVNTWVVKTDLDGNVLQIISTG